MATNPTLLLVPIAQNGTKNIIPETQATPGNGLMSQSTGFPAECSLPLGAGGVAPDRADFNGAFNLLGGVAFYAQKGWRFTWDATQDYYKGCIVIDTTDGNAYQALADVTAGGSVPSLDTTNWILYAKQSAIEEMPFIPAFNKRDVVTVSGTYTAPVTGWYRITVKGGGSGGAGGAFIAGVAATAFLGGSEGGTTIAYEYMNAGDTATVVIGAGGAGGAVAVGTVTGINIGSNGGDSSVTVNNRTYTGGGGAFDIGGTGTIPGAVGTLGVGFGDPSSGDLWGGSGGGAGGGGAGTVSFGTNQNGKNGGGGGAGGANTTGVAAPGGSGGDGFAWFEYFDPSL